MINSLCCIAPSQGEDIKIDQSAIPVWKLFITTTYSEIFMIAAIPLYGCRRYLKFIKNLPGAPVNLFIYFFSKAEVL